MGDFTEIQPKPLLRLHKGAIIDHIIDGIIATGIDPLYIAAGHLGECISQYVSVRYPGRCQVLQQTKGIGTAGDGLLYVESYLHGDFLVVHGDHFFFKDPYKRLVSHHKPGSITLLVQSPESQDSMGYGHRCRYNTRTGEVQYHAEESQSVPETLPHPDLREMIVIDGCMIFPPAIFSAIRYSRQAAGGRKLEMRETLAFIADRHLCPMYAVEIDGWWANINDFRVFAATLRRLDELGW